MIQTLAGQIDPELLALLPAHVQRFLRRCRPGHSVWVPGSSRIPLNPDEVRSAWRREVDRGMKPSRAYHCIAERCLVSTRWIRWCVHRHKRGGSKVKQT
jgi:hypothetical protein